MTRQQRNIEVQHGKDMLRNICKYTCFPLLCGTFSRVTMYLSPKQVSEKATETETLCLFPGHSEIKLAVSNKAGLRNCTNKQTEDGPVTGQGLAEDIRREIKTFPEIMQIGCRHAKSYEKQQKQWRKGNL